MARICFSFIFNVSSCRLRSLSTVNVDHVIEVVAFDDQDERPFEAERTGVQVSRVLVGLSACQQELSAVYEARTPFCAMP
jgi:hypothetical protein